MEAESGASNGTVAAPGGAPVGVAEPRQRWRLAFRRPAGVDADSPRDLVPDWLDRLAANGLPLASRGGARARAALALAAPLPVGMAAERELADLVLAERLPVWRVREAVTAALPPGCDLVELEDVWVGAPPLAAVIAGADYRVTLAPGADPGPEALRTAAGSMLAGKTIPRVRQKGGRDVAYDLRPLLADIEVLGGPPTVLKIRTRFDPERGSGRPDEVLAAVSERLSEPLVAAETVRERLLLASDLPNPTA